MAWTDAEVKEEILIKECNSAVDQAKAMLNLMAQAIRIRCINAFTVQNSSDSEKLTFLILMNFASRMR